MARTIEEIQASLIRSLKSTDESVDVAKGPVFDFLIQPVPVELAETESAVDRLTRLVTLQLEQVASTDEAQAIATSLSIDLGSGFPSSGRVTLYRYSRPQNDISIPRGAIVSVRDQSLTYFIVNDNLIMESANADAYYNSSTRRFEITADIEATSIGPDFDVPPTRINTLVTEIDGIDGVSNPVETSGGLNQNTLLESINKIRAKLAGLDPETGGGVRSDILIYAPTLVKDAALVYPKDRPLFARATNRPAIDAYVNGDNLQSFDQNYTATGGETQITLENSPATSVESVQVNGSDVTFAFVQDTSLTFGGSTRATDIVVLDAALTLNDLVEITYTADQLIIDLQNDLFSNDERTFDTDILARRKRLVQITIEVYAKVLPSFDTNRTSDSIENELFDLVQTGVFEEEYQPEVIRQTLKDVIGGLSEIRFKVFRRTEGSALDVEVITLEKNEVAEIDQAALIIDVRK